eukprot:scaffold46784_cov57-Phaeocystis_antarctica.AAC.1
MRWRPVPRSQPTAPTASSPGRSRGSSSRRAVASGRASSTRPPRSSNPNPNPKPPYPYPNQAITEPCAYY